LEKVIGTNARRHLGKDTILQWEDLEGVSGLGLDDYSRIELDDEFIQMHSSRAPRQRIQNRFSNRQA
jgi:hypothetical protein